MIDTYFKKKRMTEDEHNNLEPWCSLGPGNNPFFSVRKSSSDVSIPTFSEEDFQAHLTVFRNTGRVDGLESAELACALYYFMNRCVVQGRMVDSCEVDSILQSLKFILHQYTSMDTSYFITRILLDLYEQDVHIVRRAVFQEILTILLDQTHLYDVPIEKCCRPVVGAIGLLVTLVSAVMMYGFEDAEVAAFPWPNDMTRSNSTCSLDFLLDNPVFCDGLVHLILFGAAVFEKSFDETDIFHWDLALIATITKNQVLRHDVLENCFTSKVLNQLYRASCTYMYETVAAGFTAIDAITGGGGDEFLKLGGRIQWKRIVVAMISILLTGNATELQSVCVLPDSATRFPDILRTLVTRFGTLKVARLACQEHMQQVRTPWASWIERRLLVDQSGVKAAERERLLQENRRRKTEKSLFEQRAPPPPLPRTAPPPLPTTPPTTTSDSFKQGVTNAEREQFWKDMIEREALDVKHKSASSSNKRKKKDNNNKKKSMTRNEEEVPDAVVVVKCKSEDVSDDASDDDEASLRRLSKMKTMKIRPSKTVLPTIQTDAPPQPVARTVTLKKGSMGGTIPGVLPSSPHKKTITKTLPVAEKAPPIVEDATAAADAAAPVDEPVVVVVESSFTQYSLPFLSPFRTYDLVDAEDRSDLTDPDTLKKWLPVVYHDALYRNFVRIVSVL